MPVNFFKYQATGNDFVIIDNLTNFFNKNDTKLIARLCDRRFGIGADGLILLEFSSDFDFKMIYFNADGRESSMCGNGGRCIVAFARRLGIIKDTTIFTAIDGLHEAKIEASQISLKMQDVKSIENKAGGIILDTGSPHYVSMCKDLDNLNVQIEGSKIRNTSPFLEDGINVNFVDPIDSENFAIRTYERGVEGETLSCGTGATAVAIAMHASQKTNSNCITLQTQGGDLEVQFRSKDASYVDVWLRGSVRYVYEGTFENNF
jgi:diaminopimelate epimerase